MMRTRRRLTLLLLAQIGLIGLGISRFDSHGIRTALFEVIETGDRRAFAWPPEQRPHWYRIDPGEAYRPLQAQAQALLPEGEIRWEAVERLGAFVGDLWTEAGEPVEADSLIAIRSEIESGKSANCAHLSWLLSGYLSSLGVFSRVVGFDAADGIGGNGHAVVEVWLEKRRKWMLMDPLNSALFIRDGVPLSVLELREALLADRTEGITIRQGPTHEIPKERLLAEYEGLIRNITLDGRGDLISREKNRYGILQFMAPLLDQAPRRPRRAVANLIGARSVRVHLLDEFARPYHPRCWRLLSWALFGLISTLPLTVWGLLRGRKEPF